MNNKKTLPLILIAVSLFACAGFWGCRRQPSRSATEKRYDLKGKVVAVEKDKHLITVAHEDIKDYMPGMTMPFTLREEWAYEVLVPGDQVTAAVFWHHWCGSLSISKCSGLKMTCRTDGLFRCFNGRCHVPPSC